MTCVSPLDTEKASIEVFGWKDAEASKKIGYLSPKNYTKFQKSPLCLLMGKTDKYYTEKEAKDFFNKIPIKDKKLKIYNTEHFLPDLFVKDAINWITTHNK